MKKTNSAETRRKLRLGGYSVALVCIVLALIIAVNLIVGALPSKYTHLDASELQLYTLSDETVSYLKGIDRDVTMYLVTQNGAENNDVYEILSKYAAENDRLRIVIKDPSLYPNFVQEYTSDALSENSVIVESGDKFKVVDSREIFVLDYNAYYSTGQPSYTYDGEGRITAAVSYVTSTELPSLYLLTGHGEAELSENMMTAMENKNYVITKDLSLISAGEIPEECDLLMINLPVQDISAEEADMILDYMENGGHLMLITSPGDTEMPNLMRVAESYGLTMQSGVVMDVAADHYYDNYMIPIAEKLSHDITSEQMEKKTATLMPYSHGIEIMDQYRSTVTVSGLLQTSAEAYLKTDVEGLDTYEKESEDIDGPFLLGAAAEEIYNGTETRLVWYSSAMMDYYDSLTGGANTDLIMTSLDWMFGETSVGVNVPAKSMDKSTMVTTASQTLIWIMLMVIVLPVGCLVFGFIYWFKRRKR
ncbi:MAG: GldG family protein [Christensenellaceae bacterium]|nr:GldG family protein [Christensenellaceae bacterium]